MRMGDIDYGMAITNHSFLWQSHIEWHNHHEMTMGAIYYGMAIKDHSTLEQSHIEWNWYMHIVLSRDKVPTCHVFSGPFLEEATKNA